MVHASIALTPDTLEPFEPSRRGAMTVNLEDHQAAAIADSTLITYASRP